MPLTDDADPLWGAWEHAKLGFTIVRGSCGGASILSSNLFIARTKGFRAPNNRAAAAADSYIMILKFLAKPSLNMSLGIVAHASLWS